MKQLFTGLILLLSIAVKAQSIDNSVVTNGGGFSTGGTLNISYSIGQTIATSDVTSGGITLTQGFLHGIVLRTIITSFSPTLSTTDSTITIKGTAFTGATAVYFGDTAAKSFTVINDTIITAVVGNGASGYVKVVTGIGSDSMAGFGYQSQAFMADSLALVDLYNSTNSIYWSKKTNWLTSAPLSTWSGITVSGGRVTSVVLSMNNLNGQIPISLGNLTAVQTLDFGGDRLYGSIPTTFSNLKSLQHLYITANQLTGTIPPGLGDLPNLLDLFLYNNQLSGSIPSTFGNQTSLQNLYLYNNLLTGNIPSSLGNLVNLKWLTLDGNQLTGSIPSSIGNISGLQYFSVNGNLLSGTVPASISSLKNLKYLYLNGDSLTFAGMEAIAQMTVTNNKTYSPQARVHLTQNGNTLSLAVGGTLANNTYKWFKGSTTNLVATITGDSTYTPTTSGTYFAMATNAIATALTLFSDSINLTLQSPIISSFTPTIATTGTTITITGSNFIGTTAVSFGGVTASSFSVVNSSTITAVVGNGANGYAKVTTFNSDSLAGFSFQSQGFLTDSLALVDLYNSTNGSKWTNNTNWLSKAPLSSWYGVNLLNGRVAKIAIGNNNLIGSIPTTFGNMTQLTDIDLAINHLSGTIPNCLSSLTNLQYLSLGANSFSGTIPTFLGTLTQLQYLFLTSNQLTGSIPIEIGNLTSLTNLDFGNNQLSGTLPNSLSLLKKLVYLGLAKNSFSSSIPSFIGDLSNLQYLYLHDNSFTGTIPSSLTNLNNLITFNLNNNSLTYSGMEAIAQMTISNKTYSPQSNVQIQQNGKLLYLSVGGTLANNNYKWYKNSTTNLVASITADSTYTPTSSGKYFVIATNAVASQLTLYSDTITVIVSPKIASFLSTIAGTDSTVKIKGTGFNGITGVYFGGIPSKISYTIGDTIIMATVGNGASGYVKITTSNGNDSLSGFVFCNPTASTTNASICAGGSYVFNGTTYTTAGTYIKHLTNSMGCDSTATLNLTINLPTTATITKTACSSFTWHGATYTTSGSYTFDSLNAKGCDSLTTLNLTINQPTTAIINKTACNSFTWHGTTYTSSGTYTFDSLNAKGCDSLTTLNLTINQPTTASINKTACSSFTWHGTTYTTSGTYTFDSLNAKGCDSLTSLNLTINQPTTATINKTACSSFTWHGTTYTTSGTYTFDSLNAKGCDSLTTLNLIINQPTSATINKTACGSFTWHGTTYTTSGSYIFDSLNTKGCDSLTTLNLTINQPTTATINKTACNSFTWHGTTYTTSGSYTFDSLNKKGCDSLTTLNLTINQPTTATINKTACSSYSWHGTAYTASGSYSFDSLNAKGCDSLTTLNLTINQPTTATINKTACGSFTWHGTTYTASGSYTFDSLNKKGCDSLTTLNLIINQPTTATINKTACGSFTWHRTTYTTSGSYTFDSLNAKGCDSLTTLNLIINQPTSATINKTACNSFTWHGTTYTSSGSYTFDSLNAKGCDSLTTLNLTINQPTTATINKTACSSFTWHGTTYTTSGSYTFDSLNAKGCDSLTTLNLIINQPTTSITNANICKGSSYIFNGTTYSTPGTFIKHLTNTLGCDSAATLNLSVNDSTSSTTKDTICQGSSYLFNGNIYTTAGTFKSHLLNSVGCDSTATLLLAIKPSSNSTTYDTICQGSSYLFNGIIYKTQGTYIAHLANSIGCDSAAKLILTVKDSSSSTTKVSICKGTSYLFNGVVYTNAGTYISHLSNSKGCDSLAMLVLSLKDSTSSVTNASICEGDSYYFNGSTYTQTGNYIAHLTNSTNCDSTATLKLTVITKVTPNISVVASGLTITKGTSITFTATPTDGGTNPSYQWYKNNYKVGGNTNIYIDASLQNKDSVWCVLTSNANCMTITAVTSNKNYISVYVTPTITSFLPQISTTDSTVVIKGKNLTGTTSITFGGTASKSFTILNDSTINAIVSNGSSGNVKVTNAVGSDSLAGFTFCNLVTPKISISSSADTVCSGNNITITATVTNGGTNPNYQWIKGGVIVNGITNSFYTFSPANNDNIICKLTANNVCQTKDTVFSNTITESVTPYAMPLVSIISSTTIVCNAGNVTFTANTSYGGLNPVYQWHKNGVNVVGANNMVWNTNNINNKDFIQCNLISDASCRLKDTVTSNTITINKIVPTTNSTNLTSCNSVIYKGTTYYNSTIIKDTVKSTQGCDSIYNIANIVINHNTPIVKDTIITSCTSIVYNGKTYNSSTLIKDTIKGVQGCDSIYRVASILISPLSVITNNIQLSGCSTVTYNGKTYTKSTLVRDTLKSNLGCDSVINNVTIVITPIIPKTINTYYSGCNKVFYLGVTYLTSTTLKDTIKSVQGCDSIYNYTYITITPINAITKSVSISGCNSDFYKGITYTKSTILRDTVMSTQGCDSIYNVTTINITQITPTIRYITKIGCGGIAIYNGITYTNSVQVLDTVKSVQGCDSIYDIVTITILNLKPTTINSSLSGCNSVNYKGKIYTNSTIVKDTISSTQGCDSVYNIATITITPIIPKSKIIPISGCNSVLYNGVTYTNSTVKIDTLKSWQGCDSIYTIANINVTKITPIIKDTILTSCNIIVYHGKTYYSTSLVRDTIRSVQGCDSIYIMASIFITPLTVITNNINLSGCSSVIYNKKTYTSSTSFKDTLKSYQGCDSVINIVKITVIPIVPVTNNLLLTGCNKIFYQGVFYYSSTILKDTIKSLQGCDSIYNITTISVTPIIAVTNKVAIIGCDSVVYKGITYLKSIIFRDTVRSVQGCDSVYTVTTLSVSNITPVTNSISLSGCNSVTYKGNTYTNSTIVRDTVRSSQGCDSIYNVATIKVSTIIPITKNTILSGCNMVYYKGITYYSSDTLRDTLRSIQGCDSIFHVTIINIKSITPTTNTIKLSGCNTVIYKGITYNYSTIVRDTIFASQGCDSLYNIATITINPITPITNNTNLSSCTSVIYKGITYTSSALLRDTIRTKQGCDSIYNVANITITKPINATISLANCNNVIYMGIVYTTSTIVKDTIKTSQGCDSIYNTVTITITPITPTTQKITQSGCNSIVYNGMTYTNSTIVKDTIKSNVGCDSIYTIATINIIPINPITKSTLLSGCNSVRYKGIVYTKSSVVIDTVRSVQGCDSIYNKATITVIPSVTPTINIVANVNNVCQGTNITFTATATDTGFAPTYQWYKNNTAIAGANSLTYNTNSLSNLDSVYCILTSNASCTTNNTDTSNTIIDSIINKTNPTIIITSDSTHACAGTAINFKASFKNAGTKPTFQWLLNGVPVTISGKDSVYSYLPSNIGDKVSCILTSNATCVAKTIDTSNVITDSVVSRVTQIITIKADSTNICEGTTVTYTASTINGGTNPIYQWMVNGNSIVGANRNSYTTDSAHNGDSITCVLNSNAYCTVASIVNSNSLRDTVITKTIPTINISPSSVTLCAKDRVRFISSISNAGTNYSYQWQRNGIAIKGATDSVYNTDSLANKDIITCKLITNGRCFIPATVVSNGSTASVFPNVTPAVTIISSSTTVCIGSAVNFSTNLINGGSNPTFKWYKNGVKVDSLHSTYSYIDTATQIDSIYCIITSNESCKMRDTAISNLVYDTTISKITPSVTITADNTTVCSNTFVTFTAKSNYGGYSPTYQWKRNSVNDGNNNAIYQITGLKDKDTISCVLTSSFNCALINNVPSNKIGIHVIKNVWTGKNDSIWNHNSNWCNAVVPTVSEEVVIPVVATKNYPSLTSKANIGNLTIDSGAIFNLNGNELTVNGMIKGNGNLIGSPTSSLIVNSASTPILKFNPASNDSVLSNLTINGTGGAILANGIGITKSLNLNAGNLNLNGNNLTLKSTSVANTAVVYPVANGATITGNVTVERFIPAGNVGYRDIGTGGVYNVGSIFNNWQEGGNNITSYGIPIYGTSQDTLSGIDTGKNGNGQSAIYEYVDYNWIAVNNTRQTQLDPYLGYQLWIGGNRNNTQIKGYDSMLTTLRTSGQLVTGSVSYSSDGVDGAYKSTTTKLLSFPGNGSFIANPYACPIDWNSIVASSSGITKNYYYHDPTLGQSGVNYTAYNAKSNTNSNPNSKMNQYIQPGQAFWILNNNDQNAVRQMTISEKDKVPNSLLTSIFGVNNTPPNRIAVSLWKNTVQGKEVNLDGAVAVFDSTFTKSYNDEDAKKMNSSGENIAFIEQTGTMCIDGLPIPKSGDTLSINLSQLKIDSNYSIRFDKKDFTTNGCEVSIWDNLLNKKTVLQNGSLTIPLTPTVANYPNRFSIVFYRTKDTIIAPIEIDSVKEDNMKVYPNPISGRNMKVQISGLPIGNYLLKLFNVVGQNVFEKEIVNNESNYGAKNYQITLSNNIKSGIFILALEKMNGDKIRKVRILIK